MTASGRGRTRPLKAVQAPVAAESSRSASRGGLSGGREWSDESVFKEQVKRLKDPARVAVRLLMSRALANAGTSMDDAARDGTVLMIVLPEAAWIEPARDEWELWARGGERYDEGGQYRECIQRIWVAWSPTEKPVGTRVSDQAKAVSKTVAAGQHCVGFAAELDWLPADLVQAADHTFALSPPTVADVTEVARELCGEVPTVSLSGEQAGALTPRLLRLARRPEQTADQYIAKLGELLTREAKLKPGKAPAKPAAVSPRSAPDLESLYGMDEATTWARAVVRDVESNRRGEIPWSAVDGGCLLSGPPGVGKTIFARALVKACGVPLVTGSYGKWMGQGGHQGSLLGNMRTTFITAYGHGRAIVFIDEIDAFADRATVTREWAEWHIQAMNTLLELIDGADSREGRIVLGACNHPQRLDPALLRSGRLDRHIRVGLPDRAALAAILRVHLHLDLAGTDLSGAALAAAGATGADCELIVRCRPGRN